MYLKTVDIINKYILLKIFSAENLWASKKNDDVTEIVRRFICAKRLLLINYNVPGSTDLKMFTFHGFARAQSAASSPG